MGFGTVSDGFLTWVYFTSLAIGAAILFMMARILVLRVYLLLSQRRTARFEAFWRPLLAELAIVPIPCKGMALPRLHRRDYRRFIGLWLAMQESLADEAHERLNHVARRLGAHRIAQRSLQRKSVPQRLAALIFLGHLKDRASWLTLAAMLHDASPVISVVAARSLMQTNPAKAAPLVFAELLRREDWPVERLGLVFRHTLSPELANLHLTPLLDDCDDETAIRLLPYVRYLHHEARDALLFALLSRSRSDRLTSRVLRQVENSGCLEQVRRYTAYPRWHVRMQAVAALGRIGTREEDLAILTERLGDEQWWVRYRAAQALVRLLGQSPNELRALQERHADPYARQMLAQVMREEALSHA